MHLLLGRVLGEHFYYCISHATSLHCYCVMSNACWLLFGEQVYITWITEFNLVS